MKTAALLFALAACATPAFAQDASRPINHDAPPPSPPLATYPFIVVDSPPQLFTMRQVNQSYLSGFRLFAGATNAHFLKGVIENIPLPAASVDVVISNCVVNLSPEKDRVLAEIARVLRPGGRVALSDVVAEDQLAPADRAERGSCVGCIAGALSVSEYREGLAAAGLADVEVELTHSVADAMHGAIVRATKPI